MSICSLGTPSTHFSFSKKKRAQCQFYGLGFCVRVCVCVANAEFHHAQKGRRIFWFEWLFFEFARTSKQRGAKGKSSAE